MNTNLPPLDPEDGWELRQSQHRAQKKMPRCGVYPRDLCRQLNAAAIRDAMRYDDNLAALYQPGDEVWWWSKGSFAQLAGSAGYAIKRQGQITASWVVVLS